MNELPQGLAQAFAVSMGESGLVNNLTALLLVLPVLLILLKLMGASQRFVTWILGTMLVACNLGGAATPIGDFPAILLLSRGSMTFGSYLSCAFPPTLIALGLLVFIVVVVVNPARSVGHSPLASSLSVSVMQKFYRNVKLDWDWRCRPSAGCCCSLSLGCSFR